MKIKIAAPLLAVAVAAAALTGCGANSGPNEDGGLAAGATPPAAGKPVAPRTIAKVIEQAGYTRSLTAALKAAGLDPVLAAPGPFTLFAPSNAAFTDIGDQYEILLRPGNEAKLQQTLRHHVVLGQYRAADLRDGQQLLTANGDKLRVSVRGDVIRVDGATVEKADIEAENGFVDVINKVLLPPGS